MFQFYAPWYVLLLVLPFLMRLFLKKAVESVPEIHFPQVKRLERSFQHRPVGTLHFWNSFFFWLYLSWALMVLALMQPEEVNHISTVKNRGYDLMLAVDISASMQAIDFSTKDQVINRLDATKEVVEEFVKGRKGDRIGLITFAETAFLQVPLTLDTASVSRMLQNTVLGMAGNGTAIGDAIGLAVRSLRERPEGSRVLVLLTDGEDNSSRIPPLEAARLAKQYGLRIYTIAVGKKGAVPFPTPLGGYAMGESAIDEKLLQEIAAVTEGQYYHASDKNTLRKVYQNIDQLEKTDAEHEVHLIRNPLYFYPLGLGIFILLGMTVFRRETRGSTL